MAKEFEVKYRCSPASMARIRAVFGPWTEITMETTYYDTPDRAFSRRRWTLRRRLENRASVCTLKTPGQGLARGEWEVTCADIRAAIPMLLAIGAPEELEALAKAPLSPTCAARFTRLAATVVCGSSRLELALDSGELLGGGRTAPLCEVEAELKQGQEDDVLAFGRHLAEEYALEPEEKSKLARALALENLGI